MKPLKPLISKEYTANHLMNPERTYVPAAATDVAATFARVRAEQAKLAGKKTSVIRFKGKA